MGRAPRDLDFGETAPIPPPQRRSRTLLGVLATLLTMAVLVFAGSRVLEGRRSHLPAPTEIEASDLTLGSVLGSLLDDPEPGATAGSPSPAEVAPPVPAVSPAREPEPRTAPVRVTPPAPDPVPTPEPEPPPTVAETAPDVEDAPSHEPEPEAAATVQGLLTVSSLPRAQVVVDGQFVGWAPMLQHPLDPGSHTVTLVAEDGRRYTFRVSIEPDEEVRRVWHFDRSTWVEQ